MLTRLSSLLLAISLAMSVSPIEDPSREDSQDALSQVEMRLTIAGGPFRVGEEIPYRIEISNKGLRPILIGRQFSRFVDSPSSVWLAVRDLEGTEYTDARDATMGMGTAVRENWWVELYQGYFFGGTGAISEASHRILQKPGRYQITAHYKLQIDPRGSSRPCRSVYNPVGERKVELVQQLSSNSIWIEIIPDGN